MDHMITKSPDLGSMRLAYPEIPFDEAHVDPDPYQQFSRWLAEATNQPGITEPNAMVLATVDATGAPTTRSVLLKGADVRGFSFFTNYESKKAHDLLSNNHASITFPWYGLFRQINAVGTVTRLPREESIAYFNSRPWGSRIGAWASKQSTRLESRAALEERWAYFATLYPEDVEVPTPEHWGGFLLAPSAIEFWQGRQSRLHDRLRYEQVNNSQWQIIRYYP